MVPLQEFLTSSTITWCKAHSSEWLPALGLPIFQGNNLQFYHAELFDPLGQFSLSFNSQKQREFPKCLRYGMFFALHPPPNTLEHLTANYFCVTPSHSRSGRMRKIKLFSSSLFYYSRRINSLNCKHSLTLPDTKTMMIAARRITILMSALVKHPVKGAMFTH